jgi:putative transposase
MSWNETCPMWERMKFIAELERAERSMSELCRLFGVTRKTGYKWHDRYRELGLEGLKARSRAGSRHPMRCRQRWLSGCSRPKRRTRTGGRRSCWQRWRGAIRRSCCRR